MEAACGDGGELWAGLGCVGVFGVSCVSCVGVGGSQGGEGRVVEHQIAADAVVIAPAEAGEYGLAVGGFGDVHRVLAEFVMLKAPL